MKNTIDLDEVAKIKEKVFVALPCQELARYSDFYSIRDTVVYPPNTVKHPPIFGIYIANLQNDLARIFLEGDCEYFWLQNDDQLYPSDTLLRLLAHKKDVVVPLCLEKKAPHAPLIYGPRNSDGTHSYRYLERGHVGLTSIGACGGGGMLIHRRVFEKVADPWWTVQMCRREDGKMEQTSEDFDFCDKVVEAGFKIWCDLDCAAFHIAHYALAPKRTETGEWVTVMVRGTEQVVLPAAKSPLDISFERFHLIPQGRRR